jgi:arsenite methyltransferase
MKAALELIGNRVLDGARLTATDVALDVGTGTGLLALGALDRLGEDGEVIALDIEVDCLEALRGSCDDPRVWYLIGSAEVLPLPDAFVDAVLTRSVLMYVYDRAEAAREFFRVLRPGGRVSIREPVNRRFTPLWEVVDFGDLQARVVDNFDAHWPADRPPSDFDVDEVAQWFDAAGFDDVCTIVEESAGGARPESVLYEVGYPGSPRLIDAWRASFSETELQQLVAALGAAGTIEGGCPSVYLTATRP